ncbi:MAG: quinone-dependent dihydroorotate dehydrogenase [Ancalomicrobiaceae bacterium]|nr:quinone-dependent dihydroorotate dehydrogenase [Ancalomicrobiaceae bacterium]
MNLFPLIRPLLFSLQPETAHELTIKSLRLPFVRWYSLPQDSRLSSEILGLTFVNPLGTAAGFDKNGVAIDGTLRLGLAFTEVGTVTPRPQPGNPAPRLFRLVAEQAIINRFGFNNAGHAALRERLLRRRRRGGIVGVNIGANKDSADRSEDYAAGIEAFADLASYAVINVSSPNTAGLRDLQTREALDHLLQRALTARDDAAEPGGRRLPVLLKIAPDLDEAGLADVAEVALARAVDGLVVTNTTLSREGLTDPQAPESGGLSGRPLFEHSTRVLARMRRLVGPAMPIIGVGGIDSPETAWAKITAGANLVQLYSGLVYQGPELIGRILEHFLRQLDAHGFASIGEATGTEIDKWL